VTARFLITAPAERDLEEIFFEVKSRHGLPVAERVYTGLLDTFELLARNPEIGRHRPRAVASALSVLAHRALLHRVSR
jgi:plasmid stabilization system protein ParE